MLFFKQTDNLKTARRNKMKKFSRRTENFICEHCGTEVIGNGYTNHCPNCLWSKHVDINPGDRAADCGCLMEPVSLELKNGDYIITHRCIKCGHTRKNKTSPDDNFEEILKLSKAGLKNL